MKAAPPWLPVIVASTLLLGCEADPEGPGHGFPEVLSPAPSSSEILQAPEVFRVGGGTGPEAFERIVFADASPEGDVYAIDGIAQEVRVFGSGGEHLLTFGGRGEAPDEFLGARGVAFHPNGERWVWDGPPPQFKVVDDSGRLLRVVSRERLVTLAGPWLGLTQFADDGTLLDVTWSQPRIEESARETVRLKVRIGAVRFSDQLEPLDTIPPFVIERTAFAGVRAVPFEPVPIFAFEPDGSHWIALGPEYRVLRRSAAGDTVLILGLDEEPTAVTAQERDSAIAAVTPVRGHPPMGADLIPGVKPSVLALVALGSGRLAVVPEAGSDTGRWVDVFAADGSHEARLEFPARLELTRTWPRFRDGVLYAAARDETGVSYVVGYDLEARSPGPEDPR